MRIGRFARVLLCLVLVVPLAPAVVDSQGRITTTKEFLGFAAGDDYTLANYTQLQGYWAKIDQESDRMSVVEIGKTAEGRPMMMAIITSPENHKRLARYKEISRRLSLAEGLTDDEARTLAGEGKAVVWIDGGLHATECINAQGLFEFSYQMVSRSDPETLRILNDVILLLVPANPDGMELVSNWYMREADPKRRNMNIPRLYQKYVGHDNNRDSYNNSQPETEAISRQMYIEWFPQIMYNQHQTGPAGTVLFIAPFRDPFNYNQDPLVPMGLDLVGGAIHTRFIAENKPGAVLRNAAGFSTWFNGGIRTTSGFHNQIGILSEIIGNPTPVSVPLVPSRLLPNGGQPYPIGPQQTWHQRQSIEYVMTANRAILDVASRYRDEWLYRIYRMGKNSIERGSRDHWTLTPKRLGRLQAAIDAGMGSRPQSAGDVAGTEAYFGFSRPIDPKYYAAIRTPDLRDPRGYIIPSDQPDFLTATRFVNALLKSGIAVHRATASFTVAGKAYPAGSYVVKTAQAFRPHVMDMFEPQDHPDDIPYPGGPPTPPYDVAGYTLALQMGVVFDRILDGFDGPFEKIPDVIRSMTPGTVGAAKGAVGYFVDHRVNDAFTVTNRLLAANEQVFWLKAPVTAGGRTWPAGTVYLPSGKVTRPLIEKLAAETGVSFAAATARPSGEALKLRPIRIGVWDRYGGSMPAGWIRFMLDQWFPAAYTTVFAPTLDAGNLNAAFDVLVFADGAIPGAGGGGGRGGGGMGAPVPSAIPDEFKGQVGNVTAEKTVPALRQFVENGGTLIAIGSSTNIARHFGLPVTSAMVERSPDGTQRPLPREKYYVPGSILRVAVDGASPLAYGMADHVDVFFSNSPVFTLLPDASRKGVRPVAWFDSAEPLRSGWAWGQSYLQAGVIAVDASVGKGRVVLLGPEVTFRAQPHGTFKFLFNGLYYGSATPVSLGAR